VSRSLVYAYGVVRSGKRPATGRDWPRLPGGGPPRVLSVGPRLWLLVADVPAGDFQGDALHDRINDVDWLARCGAAHHDAVVKASRRSTFVPFRLFTLFRTDARALAEATRLRRGIERAMDRVDGCREWVVRAAVDPDSTAVRQPASAASGTEYLLRRAAVRRRGRRPPRGAPALARRLADAAGALARRTARRPASADTGVLLDLALLVPRRRERDLERTVRDWSAKFAALGCRVWSTGPWPPYSFVSVGRSAGSAGRRD